MKAAISGETFGSVMELDEILSLFQKNGIHFIEIWPENIPVKVGKTLLHKRLYANRDVEQAKKILEKYQNKKQRVYALEQDLIKNWRKIRNFFREN